MRTNPILTIFLFISFFYYACSSQVDKPVDTIIPDSPGIPKEVKMSFDKKYPGIKEQPNWELDSNGNYETTIDLKGQKWRVDFKPSGEWIESEHSMDYKDLPELVQEAVKKAGDKDNISEIELVDHATKGFFYDVEFKQKGKNRDVEFKADGTIIN